jgi:cytochrome c551/c552
MKTGILVLAASQFVFAAGKATITQEAAFAKTVQPFMAANCVGCHNAKVKTANLDLQQFATVESVRANLKVWRKVAWKIETGEMPPPKGPQPKATTRKSVLKWVNKELAEAKLAQR